MLELLRGLGMTVTVHGFRSTFRDWTAETTNTPREVAEMALAHVIGDETEAAYRRGDLFEKRRRLMKHWATFASPDFSPLPNFARLNGKVAKRCGDQPEG
jgi:integrase